MSEAFDPYHVWLGIPPQEQPANHYRLLTTTLLETNPEVIDNAADRQTAHLRTFQSSKHAKLAEQLHNEVAAARVCLLDPHKKAVYDQQLRARLTAQASAALRRPPQAPTAAAKPRVPTAQVASVPTVAQPTVTQSTVAQPIATSAAAMQIPEGDWVSLLGNVENQPHKTGSSTAIAARRKASQRSLALFAGAALLLIGGSGVGLFALYRSSADGTLTFDWPLAERAGVTLTVDGVMVPIPASGPWEYRCSPGEHQIAASRSAFKTWTAAATIAPGQPHAVAIDWSPAAMLVLNWPVQDRNGASLTVDGRLVPLSSDEPIELPVEPGNRVVRIIRPGADPLEVAAAIVAEGRKTILVPPSDVGATLIIGLPPDQQRNFQVIIDGNPVSGKPRGGGLAFSLKTGQHTIQVTRAGFLPFKKVVDLAASDNPPLTPIWKLRSAKTKTPTAVPHVVSDTPGPTKSATVETTPSESPNSAESDGPPAKKLPVPPPDEQAKLATQLDQLYKSTHTSADVSKATELYDLAEKGRDASAERYMLLVKGAELAVEGGDATVAFQGIDLLAAKFEVDPFDAKQRLLDKAVILATTPEQLAPLITAAEQLLDQSMAADRYTVAAAIAATASKALNKKPVEAQFRRETEDLLARHRRDIRMLEPLWAAAQKAQIALKQNTSDAEASLTLGRWYCLFKNDWPLGLPLLAKASDERLKSLAQVELKPPAEGAEQAELGDGWWEQGSKEMAFVRDVMRAHAAELYTASLPALTPALKKVAVQRRLAEIANVQHPTPTAAPIRPAKAPKEIASRWVDLLRMADPDSDVRKGRWKRIGSDVGCQALGLAVLDLPVELDDNYNLAVEFTRLSGAGEIGIVFPAGKNSSKVMLNMREGEASGLDTVEGKRPIDPANPTARRPGGIENRRRHQMVISVRLIDPDQVSIDVYLDGNQYLPHWTGRRSALGGGWGLPARHAGIGGYDSAMVYHSVAVQKVTLPTTAGTGPATKTTTAPALKSSIAAPAKILSSQ